MEAHRSGRDFQEQKSVEKWGFGINSEEYVYEYRENVNKTDDKKMKMEQENGV